MAKDLAQMTFSRLPNEIFDIIALNLHRRDLFSLTLTSRDISKIFTPCLWRAVHISNDKGRNSVREALQTRPTLAQTVLALEVSCTKEPPEGQEGVKLYSDLELAASLPNLKHMSVQTTSQEDDEERSREVRQSLARLRHLKSCEFRHHHSNGENWTKNYLPSLFSLLLHPSMREVCLIHFDSSNNVTSEARPIGAGLDKLSLLNCDVDARALAQLNRDCKPRELEYCYWHGDRYPPIETGLDPPQKYIDALGESGNTWLRHLTYFRDWDSEEDPPAHFERIESLEHLAVEIYELCALPLDEGESEDSIELFLPPRLQVLEILSLQKYYDWEGVFQPFLRALVAHQESNISCKLRELRIRTRFDNCLDEKERQEIHDASVRCGCAVTIGLIPSRYYD